MSTSPAQHGRPAPHPAPHAPRRRRRSGLCFILAVFLLLLYVGAAAVSYSLVASFLGATPQGKGSMPLGTRQERSASAVAGDFMQAVKSRSYLQAYNDLDDTLLVNLAPDDFKSQAEHADSCYGPVSGFKLTSSAAGQGTAQYTYSVARGKLSRPYKFWLTLRRSQDTWAITAYGNGNTLDPLGPPPCL